MLSLMIRKFISGINYLPRIINHRILYSIVLILLDSRCNFRARVHIFAPFEEIIIFESLLAERKNHLFSSKNWRLHQYVDVLKYFYKLGRTIKICIFHRKLSLNHNIISFLNLSPRLYIYSSYYEYMPEFNAFIRRLR